MNRRQKASTHTYENYDISAQKQSRSPDKYGVDGNHVRPAITRRGNTSSKPRSAPVSEPQPVEGQGGGVVPLPRNICVTTPGKSYEDIKAACARKGQLWEDPDFPANDRSCFFSQKPPKSFIWKRPSVSHINNIIFVGKKIIKNIH